MGVMKQQIAPPTAMKQRRSMNTVDRLLDAAESVIREEGLSELTVLKVVGRAQSSVGAFYRRFADREALLFAVQDRNHTRAREVYDAQVARLKAKDISLKETLEQLFSFRARIIVKDAALLHAFVVQEALGPAFQEEGRKFFSYCRSTMAELVLSHKEEISHPEPELAAEVVCRTWLALMEQVVLYGSSPFDTQARSANVDTLVAEFARAMAGYLHGDTPGQPGLPAPEASAS
jgi:AcrR family transcriptional regulator